MHEVLVDRLGGQSLPWKSVVRLTDRPDMTLDVYRGRKTTKQQQLQRNIFLIYMTFLGVSKDSKLQKYGQAYAKTDAAKQFLYKLKGLKDTVLFCKHSGNFCYLLMSLLTSVF